MYQIELEFSRRFKEGEGESGRWELCMGFCWEINGKIIGNYEIISAAIIVKKITEKKETMPIV